MKRDSDSEFILSVLAMVLIAVGFGGWYVHTNILKDDLLEIKEEVKIVRVRVREPHYIYVTNTIIREVEKKVETPWVNPWKGNIPSWMVTNYCVGTNSLYVDSSQ